MSSRALTFGYGGFADLDLTCGEFLFQDHTVMLRFMPQHPYSGPGPMLAEASGSGTFMIGQGGYREGRGELEFGPSTLLVRMGKAKVLYRVPGFEDVVGGPVGYRNVWQHLAVVRQGNTVGLYLNGVRLTPYETPELEVPTSGLPNGSTRLRIGRRSPGPVNAKDFSHTFWQYYGLIDDLAIYTSALSQAQIASAMRAHLDGSEPGLLAGWTFDDEFVAEKLMRPVTLATASDIPEHVNAHASHPVPVYYVEVTGDSAQDRSKMDSRPSKILASVPFCHGEWWKVGQGQESAASHNGHNRGAGFARDFTRVNGQTLQSRIVAAAPGRVIFVEESNENGENNAMVVYHAPSERAVYMHLEQGSFSKYFPGLADLPQNLPAGEQPTFAIGDPLCDVGRWTEDPGREHLHHSLAAILSDTWGPDGINGLPGVPNHLVDFWLSKDKGKNWRHVTRANGSDIGRDGTPLAGDWVSRNPFSPWGLDGDSLTVAPAAASRAPRRLDVFVRGDNDHAWRKRWTPETEWSAWEDLGPGRLTSAPAAVSWGPDRIDVFVRGHDNQLAQKRWTADKKWSDWRNLGGRLTSAPTVASWGPDRLDVFVRGHDGQLAHKRWTPDKEWSDWRDLGGRLTSAPAAVSWGPGRIDVFVRGHDNQLAQKRWTADKEWSDWRNLGGRLTSAPAVASWGPNRLDVFVRGHDGQLAQKRWDDDKGWSDWRNLGGELTSAPAAVSWDSNRIDVFARGKNGHLWQIRWTADKEWSDWRDVDAV